MYNGASNGFFLHALFSSAKRIKKSIPNTSFVPVAKYELERLRKIEIFCYRWYGTPCNIFRMTGLKIMITTTVSNIFKSITFAPKMHL